MKSRYRFLRKSYALRRMMSAIERAIQAPTAREKERAARWAAAWGSLCGIKNLPDKLRPGDVARQLGCLSSPSLEQQEDFLVAIRAQEVTPAPASCAAAIGNVEPSSNGQAG